MKRPPWKENIHRSAHPCRSTKVKHALKSKGHVTVATTVSGCPNTNANMSSVFSSDSITDLLISRGRPVIWPLCFSTDPGTFHPSLKTIQQWSYPLLQINHSTFDTKSPSPFCTDGCQGCRAGNVRCGFTLGWLGLLANMHFTAASKANITEKQMQHANEKMREPPVRQVHRLREHKGKAQTISVHSRMQDFQTLLRPRCRCWCKDLFDWWCNTAVWFVRNPSFRREALSIKWLVSLTFTSPAGEDTESWSFKKTTKTETMQKKHIISSMAFKSPPALLHYTLLSSGLHVWSNREIGRLALFLLLHTAPHWKASLKHRAGDTVSEAIFHAFPWEKRGSHC